MSCKRVAQYYYQIFRELNVQGIWNRTLLPCLTRTFVSAQQQNCKRPGRVKRSIIVIKNMKINLYFLNKIKTKRVKSWKLISIFIQTLQYLPGYCSFVKRIFVTLSRSLLFSAVMICLKLMPAFKSASRALRNRSHHEKKLT